MAFRVWPTVDRVLYNFFCMGLLSVFVEEFFVGFINRVFIGLLSGFCIGF